MSCQPHSPVSYPPERKAVRELRKHILARFRSVPGTRAAHLRRVTSGQCTLWAKKQAWKVRLSGSEECPRPSPLSSLVLVTEDTEQAEGRVAGFGEGT